MRTFLQLLFLRMSVLLIAVFISSSVFAQTNVKGVVTNDANQPLAGTTVTVKGTRQATSTDDNGRFTIAAPSNAVLVFTSVGFTTKEVSVNNQSHLNVSLQIGAESKLDEVVVVGYSAKKLSNISGSVSVVSGKQLTDVTSNNISSLLQGKVAGVIVSSGSPGDPTAAPSIIIRGSSSISAGSAPLYVVDGIIGGTANPNDIETVTVLKDAATTGLYGSRAANGVIIITTKSGKAGKTRIRLSTSDGFNKVSYGHLQMMNSQQLYNYEKTFFPDAVFAQDRPASLLATNTNWRDLAYRTAITQSHTLTMSGGSEKTQVYVSGNYYNEQGTLKTTGNEQYNLRTNVSHAISNKLKLNVKFDASFRKFENEASGHYGALNGVNNNMPYDNPYNADGSLRIGTEPGWIGREHDNFLHGWQYNFNPTKQASLATDVDLIYKINSNLTLSTFNRVNYFNSKNVLYYDVQSKPGSGTKGLLNNNLNNSSNLITSNRIEYNRNFGRHSFNTIGVAEAEKNYSDNNFINGVGLPPGIAVMNAASTIATAGGNTSENAFSKGLVQEDYNYDKRYFLVGSFVNESSSRFGANKRSANFYSIAGSWMLSNEHFMANQRLFDLLKVRVSYGSTGNAQISNYQSLGLYGYAFQYAGFSAAVPIQMANPDLTWEKAKTTNLGFDIGMFKRVVLNIDLYDKTTNALLLNVPIPNTSGYSSVIQNVGSVKNRGLEINLNTDNLRGPFVWKTNFNISFNRNKVLKLYQEGRDIISGNQNVSVGHDLFSWYMRKWAGVDPQTGDPLWEKVTTDANNKQVITTTNSYNNASLQFVGTGSPNFTGGMSNEFAYKGFSFYFFLNFVSGNKLYNQANENYNSDGAYFTYNSRVLPDGSVRWQKPGDIATEPKAVYGGNKLSNKPSSRYLEDGSYIRLRNVRLSYQLPNNLLSGIKLSNANIFVSGDNLWTGTKYSAADPEVVLIPGGGTLGHNYPISRKVLFGINVEF